MEYSVGKKNYVAVNMLKYDVGNSTDLCSVCVYSLFTLLNLGKVK